MGYIRAQVLDGALSRLAYDPVSLTIRSPLATLLHQQIGRSVTDETEFGMLVFSGVLDRNK